MNLREKKDQPAPPQDSDQYFRSIFDYSPVGIGIAGPDRRYLKVNPAMCRMLGYSEEELVGKHFSDITHPDDVDLNIHNIDAMSAGAVGSFAIEKRYVRKTGEIVWVSLNVVPLNQVGPGQWNTLGLAEDITARRNSLMALAISESRFRNLIETSSDWIWEVDSAMRYTYASPQVQDLLGYTPEEVIGKTPLDFMAPVEAERVSAEFGPIAAARMPIVSLRNVNRHRNGHEVVLETSGIPVVDAAGYLLGYRGIDRDISWREDMVRTLLASELKYRSLMKYGADPVLIANMKGELIEINDAAETLLGYTRNELPGIHVRLLHPADEMSRIYAAFTELESADTTMVRDVHVLSKQGRRIPVEINAKLIDVGGHKLAQAIFHDLSEQQQREALRLHQEAEHRETLVREVHHRIKNNLQGVTGILRGLARRQPAVASALDTVISQISSIAHVHGLYGRAANGQVSLTGLLQDVAQNSASIWQMEITVSVEQECQHCIVNEGEAVPLALVLNELMANACKHGEKRGFHSVSIEYSTDFSQASVRIANQGCLPPDFDFLQHRRIGTGLGLVAALLPQADASIEWVQEQGVVVALLSLSQPLFSVLATVEGSPS
jgi:PAS domain S-box-containing protein